MAVLFWVYQAFVRMGFGRAGPIVEPPSEKNCDIVSSDRLARGESSRSLTIEYVSLGREVQARKIQRNNQS